jgi:hypothetical protein
MVAYTYRLPAGIPGTVHRIEAATIEPQEIDPAAPPTAYGVAVKVVSGRIQALASGDAVGAIYGFNVRDFPGAASQDPLGTSTPPTKGGTSVLKRGYINVLLGGAAAATKGGTVYVRVAAAAAGKPIGGVEAAADGTNTVVLPGSYFMGPADAFGNTEIAYNI